MKIFSKKYILFVSAILVFIVLSTAAILLYISAMQGKNSGEMYSENVYKTPEELFGALERALELNDMDLFRSTLAYEAKENYGNEPESLVSWKNDLKDYSYLRNEQDPNFWINGMGKVEGGYIILSNSKGKTAKFLIMRIGKGYKIVED